MRGRGVGIAFNPVFDPMGSVAIYSSIIADNSVQSSKGFGPDIWVNDDDGNDKTFTKIGGGFNLVGVGNSGEFDLATMVPPGVVGAELNPQLEPLAFNGGPTKTHALKTNSPAIDLGNATIQQGSSTTTLLYDQRGFPYLREVEYILTDDIYEPRADIGAYELQSRSLRVTSIIVNDGEPPEQQSMIWNITIVFSEAVSAPDAAAYSVDRIDAAGVEQPGITGLVNIAVDQPAANKVRITFVTSGTNPVNGVGNASKPSLPDGIYELSIIGTKVVSAVTTLPPNGLYQTLDANGDGVGNSADIFELSGTQDNGLFRLFGDGNGDGTVNATDFNLFRLTYGLTSVDPGYNFAFDYDGDGIVGAVDYNYFRLRYGLELFP